MDPIEFYADIVNYGQVLGLDWTYSPDEVEQKLGMDFGENRQARQLVRDYGIVEFYWDRHDAAQPWQGNHFSVHLHRLARGTTQAGFPEARRIPFDLLRERLAVDGALLVEVAQPSDDVRGYWQPESTALVLVIADEPPEGMAPGDVYAIVLPHYAMAVSAGISSDEQRVRQQAVDQMRHLLTLDPQARSQWLRRRSQVGETDETTWWLQQFVLVDHRTRQQSASRAAWVELRLWLLNEARAVGVFDAYETAQRTAIFVGGLHFQAMADGLAAILPSADSLVRACLDAMPVTVEEVRAVDDWRTLDRIDMLRLRKARTLTSAAEYHVARLADPVVIERLRVWSELKPRLP